MPRRWISLCLLFVVFWLDALPSFAAPPNLIVMLADDLGWRDLGCYGSAYYETPNLDQLCASGMRFNRAYAAAAVCSPTRAALLTGRSPARLHVTNVVNEMLGRVKDGWAEPAWSNFLPGDEVTLAELLKQRGYATGLIGKWHLDQPKKDGAAKSADTSPLAQGFDEAWSVARGGHPPGPGLGYFGPFELADYSRDAGQRGTKQDQITERMAAQAVRFIEEHRGGPFFLYLPFYSVHAQVTARPEKIARFKDKPPVGGQMHPEYAAELSTFDDAVGAIVAAVDRLNLAGNTLILFLSDNGGRVAKGSVSSTDNAPLRDQKGSPYEGGSRVPMFAVWKGVVPAGAASDLPVITTDVAPTLLDLAGLPARPDLHLDGRSLAALLRGGRAPADRDLFLHFPHFRQGGAPFSVVHRGDWKLIDFPTLGKSELYNLADDLGEKRDLAATARDKAAELKQALNAWRGEVGAQMPTRAP